MDDVIYIFLLVFLMIFGLGLLVSGYFTAEFGSGKSRGIGAGLLVGGIALAILVQMMDYVNMVIPGDLYLWDSVVFPGFIFISAAIVGGLAAIGVFLLAIGMEGGEPDKPGSAKIDTPLAKVTHSTFVTVIDDKLEKR